MRSRFQLSAAKASACCVRSFFSWIEHTRRAKTSSPKLTTRSRRPSAAEHPLIIRTLDVGGDKPLAYLPIPREDNPFLGERGIRVGARPPGDLAHSTARDSARVAFGNVQRDVPDDRHAAGTARRESDARGGSRSARHRADSRRHHGGSPGDAVMAHSSRRSGLLLHRH